jgi:hypothetical protein
MSEAKPTIGKAIDQIVDALQPFEAKDRMAIVNTVCEHLQIEVGRATNDGEKPQSPDPAKRVTADMNPPPPPRDLNQGPDIRSLKEQKNPNSARQMACLVAYYLQESAPQKERKDSISAADLERYFKQAGYKLPKHLEQLLVDSKTAGYFESSKRGEYSLTRVGYNLVAHSMPAHKKA